jgi:hypothetical protein
MGAAEGATASAGVCDVPGCPVWICAPVGVTWLCWGGGGERGVMVSVWLWGFWLCVCWGGGGGVMVLVGVTWLCCVGEGVVVVCVESVKGWWGQECNALRDRLSSP